MTSNRVQTRRPGAVCQRCLALATACGLAAPATPTAAQLTEPFPAVFDVADLLPASGGDGSLGFVVEAVDSWDIFGAAVASAGDINGDGIDDLVVAAPGYTYCHWYYGCYALGKGGAYVIYGRDASSGGFPGAIATTDADVYLSAGRFSTHETGWAVAPLGDINGDGLDDIAVGGGVGRSYVIYGVTGPLPPEIDLPSLDAETGFTIIASGWAVASAGDVNSDGLSDIILGAPGRQMSGGSTFVFFGRESFPAFMQWTELDGANGFSLSGAAAGDRSGWSVASAGDINGDGVDDIITGAPSADPGEREWAGSSYVVYGRAGGVFPATTDLAGLDVSDGFRLDGAGEGDYAGASVSPAGDINGDGVDDIMIGAPGLNQAPGRAYVVFGRGAGGPAFPAAVDLSSLDGTDGFRLDGVPGTHAGATVARAGDVNGDGLPDALILEVHDTTLGRCYVLYGRDTGAGPGFPAVVDLTMLDGDDGFRIEGARFDGATAAASAGDINGDGADDLVIGVSVWGDRGKVYIIYGRTPDTPCYADCDASGDLDFFDFLCFQNQFAAGDPQADCDESGELDFFDFLCFQNAFAAGCP